MSPFDQAWALMKFIDEEEHENHPNYPVDQHDWERHEAEYGPDVDQNVMNISGMAELLQDLQKYSHHCLDSMDERVAVAEGLLAMGWSKSPDLSQWQVRNLE